MKNIKLRNSRLDEYFNAYHDKQEDHGGPLIKEWEEFRHRSFFTTRNKDTEDLMNQLNPLLPEAIDCIADNVMIFSSLEGCIEDLVSEGFLIADKVAYDFVKDKYDLSSSYSRLAYIDDINSGKDIESIIRAYKKSSSSYLLAIGGGRTMDYAKYISFKTDAKLLAIPSSLATHVYASPKIHALEPIKELGYKMTIDGNPAHLTFIDINLLSYLFPNKQRLVFSGFGDIMAFINARNDWKDSAKKGNERYSIFVDESIDLVIKTLENINIAEPLDNWISEYIFIQCLLCHITDWVGSAPASGAEHLFAKCIEDEVSEEPLHGEVVALGVLIFCYIRKKDVNLVRHLLDKFNISNNLLDLNINKIAVINALAKSINEGIRKDRYTILNDIEVSFEFFELTINQMISNQLISE